MDDIMTGAFSSGMMDDWADDDAKLLGGDKKQVRLLSKPLTRTTRQISPSRLILILAFDGGHGESGVELAFETMTAGIKAESAYYESS